LQGDPVALRASIQISVRRSAIRGSINHALATSVRAPPQGGTAVQLLPPVSEGVDEIVDRAEGIDAQRLVGPRLLE
jgi:hypothetical protein